jgi:hypothetical protein
LYGAGTANNYLAGDTYIGTTTTSATKLTIGGSETASSAIARGGLLNTTLVASANSDVLVGLDINPTFNNGAFTGVINTAVRINGNLDANSIRTTSTLNIFNAFGGNDVNIGSSNGSFFFFNVRNTGAVLNIGGFSVNTNLSGATSGATRYNVLGTWSGTQTLGNLQGYTFNPNYSSFTLTSPANVSGFRFATTSISGTGAVYGFEGNLNNGTDRWNLYMNGTADNYLAGKLLINTTTVGTFNLDVNGTARVSGNMTLRLDQNASTNLRIVNVNAGAASYAELNLQSDNNSGSGGFSKNGTNITAYKIINPKDLSIYNASQAGGIAILNDFASGTIKMAAGGSSTAHMTIKSDGTINMSSLPTSTAGLSAGDIWNDGGTLKIV